MGSYGILAAGQTMLLETFGSSLPHIVTGAFAASFVAAMSKKGRGFFVKSLLMLLIVQARPISQGVCCGATHRMLLQNASIRQIHSGDAEQPFLSCGDLERLCTMFVCLLCFYSFDETVMVRFFGLFTRMRLLLACCLSLCFLVACV